MGVYLSEPKIQKKIKSKISKNLAFCSGQMQGWRKNMEDAAIHEIDLGDGNALFGVFDGHGGPEVSDYVQQKFISLLVNQPYYKSQDYTKALELAFKIMDELIESPQGAKELRQTRSKLPNSQFNSPYQENIASCTGCTANVVLITDKKIYTANAGDYRLMKVALSSSRQICTSIGDSRAVLCRNGNALALSTDHKPQSEVEMHRIINAGGQVSMGRVNGGLNLTRSFGDFSYKQRKDLAYDEQMIICKPDVKEIERNKGDQFILMGCDGIWERYVESSQRLIDLVRTQIKQAKPSQKVIHDLLNFLLAKDTRDGIGCDNMTAIIIQFQPH